MLIYLTYLIFYKIRFIIRLSIKKLIWEPFEFDNTSTLTLS